MNLDDQTFESDKRVWRVTRLIQISKDLKPFKIPMKGFNSFGLKPRMSDMNDFVDHIKKVNDADLSYPIILDDEGFVMDGRHRVAKSLLNNEKYILAVRFDKTPPCCYTKD